MAPAAKSGELAPADLAAETDRPARLWHRLAQRYGLWVLLVVSLLLNVAGIWRSVSLQRQIAERQTSEVGLGRYEFVSREPELDRIQRAQFDLYIGLMSPLEDTARDRIQERRHRLQQAVEELLRLAHGQDFEDPLLRELKRQLQEQINESLDLRAVGEVIITELRIERRPLGPTEEVVEVETAEGRFPWTESVAR